MATTRRGLQLVHVGTPRGEQGLLTRRRFTGLFGLAYWYLLYPVHGFNLSRLIRGLAQGAAARARSGAP